MINYSITFDGSAQLELSRGINDKVLPLLSQAVAAIANHTHKSWQQAVLGAKLWSQEKDAYAKSITWKMTGDFSAEVESDYKYAQEIETGRPARDLKQMLNTSTKVRRTKDGRRFLVIPIRHGTSGTNKNPMPMAVQSLAKAMTPSRVIGQGQRLSGEVTNLNRRTGMSPAKRQTPFLSTPNSRKAAMVNQAKYQWGGKLAAQALKNAGLSTAEAKRYKGMVKMDTSTPGGNTSSSYMTFRIMMEGSPGWVVKAQPGKYIVRKVVQDMRPKAEKAFAEAIRRTVSNG